MVHGPRPRAQRTITRTTEVRGVGFLTGADSRVRFEPAPVDTGIVFVRDDLPGEPEVPALVDHVVPRQRRTTIQRGAAVVEMVEHVMSALAGLRVDNCRVRINAPETPGCDGSGLPFAEAIERAGIVEQDRPRAFLRIDRPVTVSDGAAVLNALPPDGPNATGTTLSYTLDYGADSPIRRQSATLDVTPESYLVELAPCRTFLLEAEANALRESGVGARTKVTDLLVYGADGPIENTERFPNECARHKTLDLLGDLALLGVDLHGKIVAHRSGHSLNAELARAIRARCGDAPPPLDARAVLKILPHRYPFLLVDRVIEIAPGESIRAVKNITVNEPCFMGHWPERPVMPGVLILEAIAQAGGILLSTEAGTSPGRMAVMASVERARFRRPVVPGDQLVLEVRKVRARNNAFELQGTASCDGRVAAEASIRLVLTEGDPPD